MLLSFILILKEFPKVIALLKRKELEGLQDIGRIFIVLSYSIMPKY